MKDHPRTRRDSCGGPLPRLLGFTLAALLPFLLATLALPGFSVVLETAPYLVFHNVAEIFSVLVSFSIFGVGWFSYSQSRDRHGLFLGAAFLGIGLLDLLHTLGYAGMPAFVTPNPTTKPPPSGWPPGTSRP